MVVEIDFTVGPHPERTAVAKGVKLDLRRLDWEALAEKATESIRRSFYEAVASKGKVEWGASVEGAADEGGRQMACVVDMEGASVDDLMSIEDSLRQRWNPEYNGIVVRVKDTKKSRYLQLHVGGFLLGVRDSDQGEWKPFSEWYLGAKAIGLPLK